MNTMSTSSMSSATSRVCRCGYSRAATATKPNFAHSSTGNRRTFTSTTRRHDSVAAADPKAIADAFLSKFASGQTFVRKQLFDANQLRLFSLTLDRSRLWSADSGGQQQQQQPLLEDSEPLQGTPVPPAYHLVYFTPAQLPGILGVDGTDASFNPDAPFTRRMWAGGSLQWPGADPSQGSNHFLRVGDTVTEITRLVSCEPKVIKKTGDSMLVVGVEKEFRDSKDNLCVVDRRNWVFREALDPSKRTATASSQKQKPAVLSDSELAEIDKGMVVREYNRDEVMLFRFSALTFNGHRIHYDKPWATEVEGHRNVVVHGPMNLIAMLDLWRDETMRRQGSADVTYTYPKAIEYRATSPVYAGEGYRVLMGDGGVEKKEAEVRVVSNDGTTCMKGKIEEF